MIPCNLTFRYPTIPCAPLLLDKSVFVRDAAAPLPCTWAARGKSSLPSLLDHSTRHMLSVIEQNIALLALHVQLTTSPRSRTHVCRAQHTLYLEAIA